MDIQQLLGARTNQSKGSQSDWRTGGYKDPSGQEWYWDALHGWTPVGMTYGHTNDPAVIKKYFKGSTPTGPPPPLDPNSQYNKRRQGGDPKLEQRLGQLLEPSGPQQYRVPIVR
jgi:hypothetical protein